jgi:MFS transporter, DHA2 family, multidrug resistance protein
VSAPSYPPLTGRNLAIAAAALSLGNFMVVLDTTITNVALSTIAGNLGVTTSEGTWIITAYAVAEAITVPLTGWLSRRFGQVRLFTASVVLFVLFSILCGLAWSLGSLVVFRVLQGLAGGPVIPLSATLLLSVFPQAKSNVALSLWGMVTVVAPIFGPIVGGLISDNLPWPWIFYINIGFGAVVALGVWALMRDRETPIERTRIDIVGLALLTIFVTALQVMIDKGRDLEWFSSGFIIGCAVVAGSALVLLIIWELTDPDPVIDLSVFKSRNWLLATVTLSLMFAIFFGNIVLTPMWLHVQMGYTATWAGYATAPMGILAVISAPIVGRLLPKIDPRWIVTFGLSVLATSFFMRAHMTSSVDYMAVATAMFVLGAGIPACLITLTSLGVSDLPPEKVAAGAGLQNFLRIMSMAIGASITQTYWEHMTKHSRAELVSAIDPTIAQELQSNAAALGFSPERSRHLFSGLVDGQSVMLATNDFYAGATLLMLGLIALAWIIRRPTAPLKTVVH